MNKFHTVILVDENDKIIDSIKHVDSSTSRVREVMPARNYLLPPSQDKQIIDELKNQRIILGDKLDSLQNAFESTYPEYAGLKYSSKILKITDFNVTPSSPNLM